MIGYGVHHPNQALRTLDLRESVRCAHFRGPAKALRSAPQIREGPQTDYSRIGRALSTLELEPFMSGD
jgi:hypothetical protein